jgi:hypothetical protein
MPDKDGKDWTIITATESIKRTRGKVVGNKITHPGPGIRVLGAIDYLVNYCKFIYMGQPARKNR